MCSTGALLLYLTNSPPHACRMPTAHNSSSMQRFYRGMKEQQLAFSLS